MLEKDLFKYIHENRTLLTCEIKLIARQMLNCIKEFHSLGYLHLDIKLENFVITPNKNVMLIDFGATQIKPQDNKLYHARACRNKRLCCSIKKFVIINII